jgi:hypothetical protein
MLTFSSFDSFGNLIASASLIVDQPFVVGVQHMFWHLDPNQARDLFDSSVSSGWGDGNVGGDNILHMFLGTPGTSLKQFADLGGVLTFDDDGNMITNQSGVGWLFLGNRLPSGWIIWSFS